MPSVRPSASVLFGLGLALITSGCATVRQIAALRSVDFSLAGVSDIRLAEVDLNGVSSFDELTLLDAGRVLGAVAARDVPLELLLHVRAENPETNEVSARLMRLEWTLFLEDRETISGLVDRPYILPPGEPRDVPILISLNLVEFFEGNARDLLALAMAVTGHGGAPMEIELRAVPTVETSLGPLRYPGGITIVHREVGR